MLIFDNYYTMSLNVGQRLLIYWGKNIIKDYRIAYRNIDSYKPKTIVDVKTKTKTKRPVDKFPNPDDCLMLMIISSMAMLYSVD